MITIEELDRLVRQEFDETDIMSWDKIKVRLTSVDPIWGGYAETYDDYLAYFLWKCGCNLTVTQDWVDGSETFTVSLPETEDEYLQNVKEAEAYWKEVIEE